MHSSSSDDDETKSHYEHHEYTTHNIVSFAAVTETIHKPSSTSDVQSRSYDPFDLDVYDDSASMRSVSTYASTQQNLKRSMKSRHLAMISLGGVIGQGVFVSSGANLREAGPAGVLIAYSLIGFIVFWVAYSLGEMSAYIPVSGSFTIFCRRFVDESFGTVVGYNYWAMWSVIVASELVSIPIVISYWSEGKIEGWILSLASLVIIFIVNMLGARSYGETEYWFSLIKILTILIFIVVGCLVSGGVIGDETYGFKNWRDPGAFTPQGIDGIINSLAFTAFSMQGMEIVGITAGEAGNPRKDVPRAIRNVFWRIVIFYIGTLFVMGMIIRYDDARLLPTDDLNTGNFTISQSPFTIVFTEGKLGDVADVMNSIILITVLSCANSGLYVASRMLLALSREGIAWNKLVYISKRGVPVYALICTALVSLVACTTSQIADGSVFFVLTRMPGMGVMITWSGITIAHFRFRRALKAQQRSLDCLPMRAPLHPFGDFFDLLACVVIAVIAGYIYFPSQNAIGIVGTYLPLFACIVGFIVLKFWTGSKLIPLDEIDLDTGRSDYGMPPPPPPSSEEEKANKGPLYYRVWKRLVHWFT
ncbi:hypothetical protein O0I10_005054 [Lichtheimia ornata]|uniref:Amino acid permease/ SLC12A domain-containing protein n=1 Tax=Lichtheimia ornata TaxID=688661 RepID=A0AAD7V5J8_9FUNG|nr:uncharacterized protein O0I10_005054 [Lichtheimia ornata]KAJ8659339.1 hypothetical protein O0I10_005054 [Lichtheimia ornata]